MKRGKGQKSLPRAVHGEPGNTQALTSLAVGRWALGDARTVRRIGRCPFRYAQRLRIGGATLSRCSLAAVA